jgi:hypothetical protein
VKPSFEEIATAIPKQALVENQAVVTVDGNSYPVTRNKVKKLRQVVFDFAGETFIAIEQNPKTKSRCAAMTRSGKKVMQFLQAHRYAAVVAAGKFIPYAKRTA